MPNNKMNVDVVIQTEQKEWLDEMTAKHSLPDASKALRVLIDYAQSKRVQKTIFSIM